MSITLLGVGDTVVNKADTVPALMSPEGEILYKSAECFEKGEAKGAFGVHDKGTTPGQGSSLPKEWKFTCRRER